MLTNGISWLFYLPLREGSWDQRKFFTIDIIQQEIGTAAQHFKEFLHRESVADGSSGKHAQAVYDSREKTRVIEQTLPKAWNQLCQEPDELLVELFAEKVEALCGHRPEPDLLAEFLLGVVIDFSSLKTPSSFESNSSLPSQKKIAESPTLMPPKTASKETRILSCRPEILYTKTRPIAFIFMGKHYNVSSYKNILLGLCQLLNQAHASDFYEVLGLQGRTRNYFSRESEGMKAPVELKGTGIYIETNQNANSIMKLCGRLLRLFNYSYDQLQVEVRD